jgi:hypothetical protein
MASTDRQDLHVPMPGVAGAKRLARVLAARAVTRGMPPAWCGWRSVREETPDEAAARGVARVEVIHPPACAANPLPRNVADRATLPADPGWFGYAFRDVPERLSGRTARVTVEDGRVVAFTDERQRFWPTVLTRGDQALILRELRFRCGHGEVLRAQQKEAELASGTWFAERVYDNHSHWMTAHLPKLCLLARRGEADDLILPARRNRVIEASLSLLGIQPARHPIHDPRRPLRVRRLTLLETDRFRPELLQPVRDTLCDAVGATATPTRRIFVSRRGAKIRRLLNEGAIAPLLDRAGFEHVRMETLDFASQIRLMAETAVLVAPHGAGLTNMMFCRPGAQVVEIADSAYPNPNFYALAVAMGLGYWMVPGRMVGDARTPVLERDLLADPAALAAALAAVLEQVSA